MDIWILDRSGFQSLLDQPDATSGSPLSGKGSLSPAPGSPKTVVGSLK